jgi:ABC-type glycerol-3-phosphate transport system permease component
LNLVNSLWTLVLMGAVGAQVVCVFILKQFIEEIPRELFETAQIDGAGHLRQIGNIVLPMSGSILATLAILQFVGNWNSLMLPLIILRDPQLLTVPVGLMRLEGEYVKQWGQLMAGYAIASIPLLVLFLFTMRLFVKGLVAGAVKG